MWDKEKGIVLGSVRHNDKSCIVHVFTEGYGHVPFIFYLSSSGRNAGRNTLLQPLTLIGFEGRIMQSSQLQHMREPMNLRPFSDIPFNPQKSAIALFLGEFLTYALREEGENRQLFRFLADAVCGLDSSDKPWNIHLFIMLKLSACLGIGPNTEDYSEGCWLDLQNGIFVPEEPMHAFAAGPATAFKAVRLLECNSCEEARLIPMTGSERASMLNVLNDYYRLHLPEFPTLKSIEVLQDVFR